MLTTQKRLKCERNLLHLSLSLSLYIYIYIYIYIFVSHRVYVHIYIYIYISWPNVVEGDTKDPFSIAIAAICKGGHNFIPWIATLTLDLFLIKLSLWYDSTWDWTPVFRTIGENSTTVPIVQYIYLYRSSLSLSPSSSSSTSSFADSAAFPDSPYLSPSVPIFHHSWQIF